MTREVLDFYETKPWQTRFLLDNHPIRGRICEPCVGDWSIANVLVEWLDLHGEVTSGIITGDVDLSRTAHFHGDATLSDIWNSFGEIDWVVMNPPFSHSYLILIQALKRVRIGVAMLQRCTWREPTKDRGYWLQRNPPDRQLTMPRASYKKTEKSSNDSATHDWFIWDKSIVYPPGFLKPNVIGFDAMSS